jgi:Ca2+-transporting ATPase
MGRRGTDVAREASALVLLDDGFDRIVETLRLGRCVFDNMGRAIAFIFAVHVPVIALSLIPVLLQWDPLLTPIHIVLFELVIDPACSIVLESEPAAADVMQRPPRPAGASPFDASHWRPALLQGTLLGALLLFSAYFLLHSGHSAESVRAITFTALLACIVLFIPLGRVKRAATAASNLALRYLVVFVALLVTVMFSAPSLRELLRFNLPTAPETLTLLGIIGVAALLLRISGTRQRNSSGTAWRATGRHRPQRRLRSSVFHLEPPSCLNGRG